MPATRDSTTGDEEGRRPEVSVVAPVFNESGNLRELHRRLRDVLGALTERYEILLVDDGSRDDSYAIMTELAAADPRVRPLKFSRNFGHHIAMTAGLDHANGDVVIMMDSDLQDRPEEIPRLVAKIHEGWDIVATIRKNKKFSLLKRINSAIFHGLMRHIFRRDFIGGVFRAMRRKVVLAVRRCREHERLLVGLIDWTGFRQTGIEVEHAERHSGTSHYSFAAQLQLAVVSITAFSTLPLRLASWMGFLISGVSFVGALYLVARRLIFDHGVEGWTSTLVVVSILGGLQLLALGVLGEYVGRIFTSTRQRPLYVLDAVPTHSSPARGVSEPSPHTQRESAETTRSTSSGGSPGHKGSDI